jgi:hypothetical protein
MENTHEESNDLNMENDCKIPEIERKNLFKKLSFFGEWTRELVFMLSDNMKSFIDIILSELSLNITLSDFYHKHHLILRDDFFTIINKYAEHEYISFTEFDGRYALWFNDQLKNILLQPITYTDSNGQLLSTKPSGIAPHYDNCEFYQMLLFHTLDLTRFFCIKCVINNKISKDIVKKILKDQKNIYQINY